MYVFIDKTEQKAHIFASQSQIADHLKKHIKTINRYFKQMILDRYENKHFVIYRASIQKLKAKPRGNKYNLNYIR